MRKEIENDIRDRLERIDRRLGFLDCVVLSRKGSAREALRRELEKLNGRYARARNEFHQAVAEEAGSKSREEALMGCQMAVKDLELAVKRIRARQDSRQAVQNMADLLASHRW